jgi:hypothetical protein
MLTIRNLKFKNLTTFFSLGWPVATGPLRVRSGLGLLATAALAACTTVGQQANQPQASARRADVAATGGLRWDMPRAEVDALIGQPDGMQQGHGEVVYQYLARPAPGRGDGRADYYAIFRDERLAGWGTGRVRTVPGPVEAGLVVDTLVGGAHPPPRVAGRTGPASAQAAAPGEVAGTRSAAGSAHASVARREEESPVAPYRVAGPVAASVTTAAAGSDDELPGAVEAVLEPGAGALIGRFPPRGDPSPVLPIEEEPPPTPEALALATTSPPVAEPSARGTPEPEDREAGPLRKMLAGVRRRMEAR